MPPSCPPRRNSRCPLTAASVPLTVPDRSPLAGHRPSVGSDGCATDKLPRSDGSAGDSRPHLDKSPWAYIPGNGAVGERVPFYVLLFLPGAPQAGARHPVSARSPGVVVRVTRESGSDTAAPGARSVRRPPGARMTTAARRMPAWCPDGRTCRAVLDARPRGARMAGPAGRVLGLDAGPCAGRRRPNQSHCRAAVGGPAIWPRAIRRGGGCRQAR
jgi:hypothetical protein